MGRREYKKEGPILFLSISSHHSFSSPVDIRMVGVCLEGRERDREKLFKKVWGASSKYPVLLKIFCLKRIKDIKAYEQVSVTLREREN